MFPIAPNAASEDIDWLEELGQGRVLTFGVGEEEKPLQVLSNTDINKAFDDILLNVFEEFGQKPVGKENPLQDKKQQHKYLSKKKKEKSKR